MIIIMDNYNNNNNNNNNNGQLTSEANDLETDFDNRQIERFRLTTPARGNYVICSSP